MKKTVSILVATHLMVALCGGIAFAEATGKSVDPLDLQRITSDKTHIGNDVAIFYRNDGFRIVERRGVVSSKVRFSVNQVGVLYRHGESARLISYTRLEGANRYKMCEGDNCTDIRVVGGNPLGLEAAQSDLELAYEAGGVELKGESFRALFEHTTFIGGNGYLSYNGSNGNRILKHNGKVKLSKWWFNSNNELCLENGAVGEVCGVAVLKRPGQHGLTNYYAAFYGDTMIIDEFQAVLGNIFSL